jgi:ferredoxin-NADP reductase
VSGLQFTQKDEPGFWELRGHHIYGDPWREQRFARTWDDVIFRDELIAMHDRNDGFKLALALTPDAPRRAEDFGRRVDPAMVAELMTRRPAPPRHVFVCGGNPFVEAAADGAIAAGVDPNMIRTERYGG